MEKVAQKHTPKQSTTTDKNHVPHLQTTSHQTEPAALYGLWPPGRLALATSQDWLALDFGNFVHLAQNSKLRGGVERAR